MTKNLIAVFVLVGAFISFGAAKAEASFIAYVCNDANCSGGDDFAVADTDADGVILATGTFSGISVSLNLAESKPLLGSTTNPLMDLTFNAVGSGDVYFYASDTDFAGTAIFTGNVGGSQSNGGTVDFGLFGGSSNNNLDLTNGTTSGSIGCSTLTGCFYGTSLFLGPNFVSPYSLTLFAHALLVNGVAGTPGTASGNYLLVSTPVPEPATMILLGTGLLGLAAAARRGLRGRGARR
jgi:PEP-CTERM motif